MPNNVERIADLAAKHGLSSMYPVGEFVEAGGLLAHGVSCPDLYRRTANDVDRILKGAKPGDLPVEKSTKFELTINLRAAEALGLTIPRSLLLRADRMIDP